MVDLKRSIVDLTVMTGQLLTFQPFPVSPGFDIQKVTTLAQSLPSHSWEFGTASQALLELYNPHLSVFDSSPFPVPTVKKKDVKALAYAASKIEIGDGASGLGNGNGAVGDPASLGVSAILLGKTEPEYAEAARQSIDFLLNSAPRFYNGAISHRAAVPELWADFMYMAPPFLAYYAADISNVTLLHESVKQCGYYREVLQSNTTAAYKGVWEHIIGPQSQDTGIWSTGNAWAAAGMVRVLATVMRAPIAASATWKEDAVKDLTTWIMEILDGATASTLDGGLLRNYLNENDTGGHGFGEISGSSMLASVAYRMAVLQPQACGQKYINWADGIRGVLGGKDDNGKPHITEDGVATPAVNPLAWKDTKPFTTGSPEGQGFVVLMYSAWRDCILASICNSNSKGTRRVHRIRRAHSNSIH
ncbi:hypothetical protein H0H87_006142 [Tephrocybe sp. NHM501043]|nr:hypothetical protein H0H87_006142 [Tephrocybe sp. NHM501043]